MNFSSLKIAGMCLTITTVTTVVSYPQIPMKSVLSRITVRSEGNLRGLVDIVGFPQRADQMDFIGKTCEELERDAIRAGQSRNGFTESTALICGVCPHDDYVLAARVYAHVERYMKAGTVILIGNAHWSETFGIRNKLIFGDFKFWRGPYGQVPVSQLQASILSQLPPGSYVVNRQLAETEHSLEALVPFLQYYNRKVQIVPIMVPFSDWSTLDRLGKELAQAVSLAVRGNKWQLGKDLAVLCTTDGQHYGDYGWGYYNYHPFGCDAEGYRKALALDAEMIKNHLEGPVSTQKLHDLFSLLVDQNDISKYKVTWCGRFAVPFGVNFAGQLTRLIENRDLSGFLLRTGSSLSDPWLPLKDYGLGITSDVSLHHFVTYFSIGLK